MKKRVLLLMVCGVFAAAMIAGCAPQEQKAPEPAPTPTEEENDTYTPITHGYLVYLNDVLGIGLSENPTTGYTWSYALDGTGLVYTSDEYLPDSTNENIVGAGGEHDFVFTGQSEGTSTITFTESQNWEGGEVANAFVLLVQTDQNGNILSVTEEL